ncbi:ZIP family metal transporter [Duganella radicis]|uniref:ZIP family metal transporter n=1 Tax=Duganella radicis TaxID=551988 RepID=A0A6L6PS59_9BURK|nr:ZIP family metal transporter [Duganella radicis]MTV41629.1 ZIP family metal transporter [Duganella radicis]
MHSPPLRHRPAWRAWLNWRAWRAWLARHAASPRPTQHGTPARRAQGGVRRWRVLAGGAIALAGLLLLLRDGALLLAGLPAPAHMALVGGLWAAAATAAGTLPILLSQNFSQRSYDAALGLGGGIMLAATSFSLVLPALSASRAAGANAMVASTMVGAGILLGMALVMLLGHLVQSERVLQDTAGRNGPAAMTRAWLFVAAVAIHNLPEGVAIGVGYGGVDAAKAHTLATGIAIQDIPEGLVVALALRGVGYGRAFSALLGAVSGLIEPVGAVAGALLIEASTNFLPWGLAGAAGAMLYVICHDVVPEAQRHGHCNTAACALVIGFIVMMVLDTALA